MEPLEQVSDLSSSSFLTAARGRGAYDPAKNDVRIRGRETEVFVEAILKNPPGAGSDPDGKLRGTIAEIAWPGSHSLALSSF